MPYAEIDGLRTSYDREGSGPAMVLVHGAAQDSTSWRYNIAHFAERYDVVAVDLPGHGKSALPPGGPVNTVGRYADHVWSLVQHLELDRPIIVGHSLAGAIALRIGVDHSSDIAAVVVVDGAAFTVAQATNYTESILNLVGVNPTDWLQTMFLSVLGRSTPLDRRKEMAFDARRVAPEVGLADLEAYTGCDFLSELPAIDVPVFVVVGEDDWSCTPARAKQTFDAIRAPKEFHVFGSLGHIPHTEQPDIFNARLDAFLNQYGL